MHSALHSVTLAIRNLSDYHLSVSCIRATLSSGRSVFSMCTRQVSKSDEPTPHILLALAMGDSSMSPAHLVMLSSSEEMKPK